MGLRPPVPSMFRTDSSLPGSYVVVDAPSPDVTAVRRIGVSVVPTADSTYAGGGGGKECEARHERSNDWPQGGRSPHNPENALARSAPPNPDNAKSLTLYGLC